MTGIGHIKVERRRSTTHSRSPQTTHSQAFQSHSPPPSPSLSSSCCASPTESKPKPSSSKPSIHLQPPNPEAKTASHQLDRVSRPPNTDLKPELTPSYLDVDSDCETSAHGDSGSEFGLDDMSDLASDAEFEDKPTFVSHPPPSKHTGMKRARGRDDQPASEQEYKSESKSTNKHMAGRSIKPEPAKGVKQELEDELDRTLEDKRGCVPRAGASKRAKPADIKHEPNGRAKPYHSPSPSPSHSPSVGKLKTKSSSPPLNLRPSTNLTAQAASSTIDTPPPPPTRTKRAGGGGGRGARKAGRLSGEDYVALFNVALRPGPRMRDFEGVVPGRTAKQAYDNWTTTVIPFIRKALMEKGGGR